MTAVMWQVRLKYWCAMPRLTGRRRFIVGPSSTRSCFTTRSSRLKLKLCSALAAAAEMGRGREPGQPVADHVLGDVDGHVLAPVVDGHRVADHVREDRRSPGPGPDHLLVASRVHLGDLLLQVLVDVRALLQ